MFEYIDELKMFIFVIKKLFNMNIKAKYILFFLLLFAITSCKNFLENSFISNNSVSDITLGNKEEEVLEKLKKYDVFESTPFNLSYHHKGDKHYDVFKNDQKYFSLIFEDDKLSFVRVHSDSLVTYSDIRIGNTFEEIKKSDLRLYGFTEVNDGIRTQIEEYKEMYFIFDKRIDTYKLNNKAKLKEIWVGSYVPYITYDWITNKEDYGVVKDNMYTNKMFGFQLKIPEKCVVKTGKSTIPRVKELLHIYNDKKESFLSLKAIRVDKNKYEVLYYRKCNVS